MLYTRTVYYIFEILSLFGIVLLHGMGAVFNLSTKAILS